MFLRNYWYVAGWADDFGPALKTRTIIGEPIVFFRTSKGEVAALADRCPHRLVPLSMGKLMGNTIECGYHGLTVNAAGRCTRIPAADTIPDWAHVRRYPTVERDGYLWIWMGEAGRADASLVPCFPMNQDPARAVCRNSLRVEANYQLITDNLLDLTHIQFIHPDSLGNADVYTARSTVRVEGTAVRDRRTVVNTTPPPSFQDIWGPDIRVDYWLDICWTPPATYFLEFGITPTGKTREKGAQFESVQILTPETETSTLYHWTVCRAFDLENKEMTESWRRAVTAAFDDDRRMLEAQQRVAESADIVGRGSHDLSSDESGVAARKIIARLLAAECTTVCAAE